MSRTDTSIKTADGDCRSYVFRPDGGAGPWPAVLYLMDAPAIRPVLWEMGQRIADAGYLVLMPDLFYRAGPYEPFVLREIFGDPEKRAAFWQKYAMTTSPAKVAADTAAYLAYLDSLGDVKGTQIGVTGYCMGGSMALVVAATYPERVAAAGAFHGGRMATDHPESPHLMAAKIKAKVLVAGADEDAGFPPEQREKLSNALTGAGVSHRTEIWAGAKHGWTMRDQPVYDEAAAERHLRELIALYDETLKAA